MSNHTPRLLTMWPLPALKPREHRDADNVDAAAEPKPTDYVPFSLFKSDSDTTTATDGGLTPFCVTLSDATPPRSAAWTRQSSSCGLEADAVPWHGASAFVDESSARSLQQHVTESGGRITTQSPDPLFLPFGGFKPRLEVKNTFLHFSTHPDPRVLRCGVQSAPLALMRKEARRSMLGEAPASTTIRRLRAGRRTRELVAGVPPLAEDTLAPHDSQAIAQNHKRGAKPLGPRKFLCTFFVDIAEDKKFHVVRRVLGWKGLYMKRITQSCPNTRIRLRGKGSGFLEGDMQLEANVPLQLNVSSPCRREYEMAKRKVSSHLGAIYDTYEAKFGEKKKKCVHEHPKNPRK